MKKKIQTGLALAGIALGIAITPVLAHSANDSKVKASAMSSKAKMMEIDKMSTEDKAALFEKLSDSGKNAATKMAGHDMGKMSAHDRMAMTEKMSVEDKAMSYSKIAKSKHLDKADRMAVDKAVMDKAAMDKMAMEKK